LLSRPERRLRPVVGGRRRPAGRRGRERRHRVMGQREEVTPRRDGGFTLLELIITLLVIALAVGLTVPAIGRSSEGIRVRAEIAGFSAVLRHARELAITSHTTHAVVIDTIARRMTIRSGGPEGDVRQSRLLPGRLTVNAI